MICKMNENAEEIKFSEANPGSTAVFLGGLWRVNVSLDRQEAETHTGTSIQVAGDLMGISLGSVCLFLPGTHHFFVSKHQLLCSTQIPLDYKSQGPPGPCLYWWPHHLRLCVLGTVVCHWHATLCSSKEWTDTLTKSNQNSSIGFEIWTWRGARVSFYWTVNLSLPGSNLASRESLSEAGGKLKGQYSKRQTRRAERYRGKAPTAPPEPLAQPCVALSFGLPAFMR